MTNLVLARKAGQSVRLIIGDLTEFLHVLNVTDGTCLMSVENKHELKSVRFRDSMQIAEGVSVQVVDLAKGHAKLNFTAPRDVHILRTELIKEEQV